MSESDALHVPVMRDRCVELLAPALAHPGAVVVDGTLGLGGHSEALLESCPEATLVGIDRDLDAIALASERLSPFGDRFHAHHAEYDDIAGALALAGVERADGILLDLGVSSMQIDSVERGFRYASDAPLDMRMNREDPVTAADLLRDAGLDELTRIIRDYGEERHARRIARAIVERRDAHPLTRSGDLVALVTDVVPAGQGRGNPAKRTFQALRIAVNREIEILERAIAAAIELTAVGGRIVVESYHSLEDRIVKLAFAAGAEVSTPPGIPVIPDRDQPYLKLITRGAEKAPEDEQQMNPRSASVRLRAAERIRETPPGRAA